MGILVALTPENYVLKFFLVDNVLTQKQKSLWMDLEALNNKGIAEVHSRRPLNELIELIWQFENENVVANVTTQTNYQFNRCWKIKSQSKCKEQWTCKKPIIKAIGVERLKANQNVRNNELAKRRTCMWFICWNSETTTKWWNWQTYHYNTKSTIIE